MEFLAGTVLAFVIGVAASFFCIDKDRAFYPVVTIVIASYYVLFAVIGGSFHALVMELVVMAVFVIAAVVGFKYSSWLVVAALATHGILDIFHGHMIANAGVPVWWPEFCLAYDIVAAGYFAFRLAKEMADQQPPASCSVERK